MHHLRDLRISFFLHLPANERSKKAPPPGSCSDARKLSVIRLERIELQRIRPVRLLMETIGVVGNHAVEYFY